MKSPKSPAKGSSKSPIAKLLTPKSPVKSQAPKSPVKSPVRSPVKVVPKSPVKEPVSMNLNEDALHSWDTHLPEGYEEAKVNQYTADVEKMISSKKLNGQHVGHLPFY